MTVPACFRGGGQSLIDRLRGQCLLPGHPSHAERGLNRVALSSARDLPGPAHCDPSVWQCCSLLPAWVLFCIIRWLPWRHSVLWSRRSLRVASQCLHLWAHETSARRATDAYDGVGKSLPAAEDEVHPARVTHRDPVKGSAQASPRAVQPGPIAAYRRRRATRPGCALYLV
jgi:hypothetical protein